MLKKDSKAWQHAKKRSRRKNVNSVPMKLNDDESIIFYSLIRGNTWTCTREEVLSLL